MLVFSCSGLDAVIKQLIKDSLVKVIEKEAGAQQRDGARPRDTPNKREQKEPGSDQAGNAEHQSRDAGEEKGGFQVDLAVGNRGVRDAARGARQARCFQV